MLSSHSILTKVQSLVVACGVRKVWSKELDGCETPSSQIAHLKKLLAELGMKGRLSLEQAKTIRAKRELAQELGGLFGYSVRDAFYCLRLPTERR